jgi:hypothetical protein
MAKRDGIYDGLGHVNPARSSAQMAAEREPLLSGPVPLCATPGCLRDVRANGLCIECLEGTREIAQPYSPVRLAGGCACLLDRATGAVVTPCESHQRQADREAGA